MVELLVAMAITLVIAAGVLTLALAGRKTQEVDRVRVGVNRSLRAAGDFLVTDIRRAGERLGDDFPAIEVVEGGAGAPDQLILRRNLIRAVLRVCSDTGGTDDQIEVAWKPTHPSAPPPAGCTPLPDDDADGWPDNIQLWREHRIAEGGKVFAYIYDPINEQGETFGYDRELENTDAYLIQREGGTGSWTNTYPMANQVRLYILEEHAYRLSGGVLELVVNGDTSDPDRLVDRIVDFQVEASVGGVLYDSLRPTDAWYDWVGIEALHLTLDGNSPFRLRSINRQWRTRVLPRNVLSR